MTAVVPISAAAGHARPWTAPRRDHRSGMCSLPHGTPSDWGSGSVVGSAAPTFAAAGPNGIVTGTVTVPADIGGGVARSASPR